MISSNAIFFSLIGGILPALFWLYFWLREDKLRPEPRFLIMFSFFGGMIAVIAALFAEKITGSLVASNVILVAVYAPITEELFKFLAAYFTALRNKEDDEPIDPIMYLMSSALGFAALENALFLISPLAENHIMTSIVTGNLRFVGATLLHIVASASIGIFIGFSFYKSKRFKFFMTIVGLVAAIALHSFFNLFIIRGTSENILSVFAGLWVAVIFIILILEKVKKIKNGGQKINS
ncbi:MAG: PrsW family intramembrane metalloprotease [Patescibacteria group bacterium]|nr:PrsW family intramembrane metalloprotease [Patescibacteria group bacterium]MDE1988226.1 PrsW family intramembrane metalloprotease [Patescibacteria group bacterium]MDE2218559.1 PrsW family intramembrane metalloprotease [Patescibacteria group bacterium]